MAHTSRASSPPTATASKEAAAATRVRGGARCFPRRPLLALVLVLVVLVYTHPPRRHAGRSAAATASAPASSRATAQARATEEVCGAHAARGAPASGFTETPVESTVLMLYSPSAAEGQFCYSGTPGAGDGVEREFLRVAASYVSSPHEGPAGPYYDFFAAHDATLWTVDGATRVAEPMRLDVVYTFVNPSAPSFRRNLEARRVPFEQRRYRDWEELRYSLRSLREFVLRNGALAQYHRRHAADVARLGELGYTVNASAVDGVVPLVRRVYLVLSDADQVPEWLDVEAFPELRVVTHREMFSAEEAAWVLPTLNSNVIESGLHRIPGISRFFLYFNNDMLVGRRMSFFDLFRPLSPPRQLLELERLRLESLTDAKRSARAAAAADPRVAMLLETVLHSDGYVKPPARPTVARFAARWVPAAWCTDVLADAATAATETTRETRWTRLLRSICAPPRLARPPMNSGNVLNRLARFHVQEELPGVVPSFEYAHVPRVTDREVLRVLLEDPVNGFAERVREMRRAYRRNMNNFSPAHLYEAFALAMRRARTAALWCLGNATCAATLEAVQPRTTRRYHVRRAVACPDHPLEGIGQAARLQHSDLIARWSAYEGPWLRRWVETAPATTTSTMPPAQLPQVRRATGVGESQDDAAAVAAEALLRDYTPSDAVRALLSDATAHDPGHVTFRMVSGCEFRGGTVDAARVQSLVLDVHHHVSTTDLTFRFFIVEDFQRLAIVLSRLEHHFSDAAAPAPGVAASEDGTGGAASRMPLYVTVNDDLDGDVLDRQLRSSRLMGWNESQLTTALFHRLLWLCSSMAPPAPWEHRPAPA